jgi:hypothetical protein
LEILFESSKKNGSLYGEAQSVIMTHDGKIDSFSFITYRLEKKQKNRIIMTATTDIYKIKLKIMLLNFINLPIAFQIYTFVRSCQFIVRFYLESKRLR